MRCKRHSCEVPRWNQRSIILVAPLSILSGKLDVMTDLLKRARGRLDEIGRHKGRAMTLGALFPAVPDSARKLGLDVLTWIEEGLLDYVVPKHFIRFLMDEPMEGYLAAARPPPEAGEPISSFRGAAASYWGNHRPHPHTEADRRILQEIGDPQLIRRKDKRFALVVAEAEDGYQLPMEVAGVHTIRFVLGDDTQSAADDWSLKSARLRLEFNELVIEEDRIELALNGEALPAESRKTSYAFANFVHKWIEYDLTQGPLPL